MFVNVAQAAEAAGFEYVLVPVASPCWDPWNSTAMFVPQTTSIDMLVAARPGVIASTIMAKAIST